MNLCIGRSLMYVPTEGLDAGKTFYPHVEKRMSFGPGFRFVDKASVFVCPDEVIGPDSKRYSVGSVGEALKKINEGWSLLMETPGATATMWVSALKIIESNKKFFPKYKEVSFEESEARRKAAEEKLEKLCERYGVKEDDEHCIYELLWESFREYLAWESNIDLVYDAIGIRPTADNMREFIIALIINGNIYLRRAAEEMLAYGYVSGEEPRETKTLDRARRLAEKYHYETFSYEFLLNHYEEWKKYRHLYKPLTAAEVWDKYGSEGIKERWALNGDEEEWCVDFYDYVDFESDPTWVGDLIGGTNRVKELFYFVLWDAAMQRIDYGLTNIGLNGEELLKLK